MIHYTWEEALSDITKLYEQVKEKFQPNIIVGINRGGLVPSVILSHLFNVKHVPFDILYDEDKLHSITKRANNVLIVDEICDTGKMFRNIRADYCGYSSQAKLKYASLWYNTSGSFKPDFFVRTIDKSINNEWIVMPWEIKYKIMDDFLELYNTTEAEFRRYHEAEYKYYQDKTTMVGS